MPDNWREVDFTELTVRSVDWRVSARGNLWARLTVAGRVIRATVFENERRPGEFSYVWSRELSDGTEEKHFSPSGYPTIEAAKTGVLVACGYLLLPQPGIWGPPSPTPTPPLAPPKPKRTGVPAEPPIRKIIL